MSIHPSLRSSEKDRKQRSVLKRTERLKIMLDKNQWKETDSVFGLPKIKTLKIRIKKEKVEKVAEGTTAEQAAAPATGSPAVKGQAAAKAPAPKEQAKK